MSTALASIQFQTSVHSALRRPFDRALHRPCAGSLQAFLAGLRVRRGGAQDPCDAMRRFRITPSVVGRGAVLARRDKTPASRNDPATPPAHDGVDLSYAWYRVSPRHPPYAVRSF